MNYLEILNRHINIHVGVPFIVELSAYVSSEEDFQISFDIMGKPFYFMATENGANVRKDIISIPFEYDSTKFIQKCKTRLIIYGEHSNFPIQTVLKASMEGALSQFCKIDIYESIA